jgi:hypothetical protein
MKIRAGKSARNKLNEMAEARVVMAPFMTPFTKKVRTLYIGTLSNPGITIVRSQSSLFFTAMKVL